MPKLECEVRTVLLIMIDFAQKTDNRRWSASRRKRETSCHSFMSWEIETLNWSSPNLGEFDGNNEVWCDAIMRISTRRPLFS